MSKAQGVSDESVVKVWLAEILSSVVMGGLQMLLFVAVLAFTVLPAHAAWGSSQSIIDAPPSPTPAEWADDINATASVVDTLVRGRLKHIYARTKTDACRHQIATKLTDYLTSEIEEHGPWMKTLSKQVTEWQEK